MSTTRQTWLIVGATRGIGLEYVRQLLALGHLVLATARDPSSSNLLALASSEQGRKNLKILKCDVSDEASIHGLREQVLKLVIEGLIQEIDVVVLNAAILEYPGRVLDAGFSDFANHLNTNTIGPLLCASALLSLTKSNDEQVPSIAISTLLFISSDSGSAASFRAFEDGFGVYAASKAALNHGLRCPKHLAAELGRKYAADGNPEKTPVVLAIHPGEVTTDMAANVDLPWDLDVIGVEESVEKMLRVVEKKRMGGLEMVSEKDRGVATFWDWKGNVYPW